MARHTRYYDTATQAVLAWLALLVLAVWCAVFRPAPGRHASSDSTPGPLWPDVDEDRFGATEGYAVWLHVENQSPVVREEARV